jgi:phosphate starvation-inducible PhoH-like protein
MNAQNISVVDSKTLLTLFGPRDQYLRKIRSALGVTISARGDRVQIEGNEQAVAQATTVLEQLKSLAQRQGEVSPHDVARALSAATGQPVADDHAPITGLTAAKQVRPRTPGQANYVKAIQEHDLVFCVGPAGTGKTYLAVALAISALKQERIKKIVLVRPAVEAGED